MTESEIVHAAQHGDIAAFEQLVTRYQQALIASARLLSHDADDAEDLAQETLIEAFRKLNTLRDVEKFRGWLFTILRSKFLNSRKLSQPEHASLDNYEKDNLDTSLASEAGLAELLLSLPLTDREILSAHYLQELSFEEIADVLGISANAARVRCSRARERLRIAVREQEEETRRIMAAFMLFPVSSTFTERTISEVSSMASITRTLGTKSLHSISFTGLSVWGKQILMAALIMTGLGIAISFPTPMRQRLSQQFLRLQQNPDIHPAMTKSDEGQQECDKCIAHEKLLAQKILNWASIHHTLPNAERWWQEVGVSGELLTCPTAPHTPVAYGLNPSLSGKSIKSAGNDPVHTVLLIEGHYEDNNLFLFDFRHPDKRMVVAFLDGHVDMLTAKQLTEAMKSTKSGWQDRITPGFNFVSGIGSVPVDHGFAVTCSIIRNVKLASLTTYISLDHEGENPIRTIPITVVPSQQTYTISWDGHDEQGHQMPPGIYWMNIVAETPDGKLGVEPLRFRLH